MLLNELIHITLCLEEIEYIILFSKDKDLIDYLITI